MAFVGKAAYALAQLPAELASLRWMREPSSSGRIIAVVAAVHAILRVAGLSSPLRDLLLVAYPLALQADDQGTQRYGKGFRDLQFLAFYIIVFSFVRQAAVRYLIRPLALRGGIRGERKLERFTEQGYAFLYWSMSSLVGVVVMSQQPTWWYNTQAFWIDYPHWRMLPQLKAYYLLQFSYWLQQLLVLVLRIEKPRSDFAELCAHHIVTLWLVGWSYFLNLTYIGVAIFFSMDIADVFLAISKMLNYLKLQRTSEVSFAFFLCVWTYFRHWQNLRILWSVWFEYPALVPQEARVFKPWQGVALSGWMRYQVFAPILALQCLNLFWYALMWRIIYRMLKGSNATDTREAEEMDEEKEE